ncbi:unnamed protein product [Peniophora sp. CBMAI 1063]|nr:unnamed protein product [Peniophora sp. CBMAI 1063]
MPSFLPTLPTSDVQQAAQLIYRSYNPSAAASLSPEELRRLQQDLFELQKRPEAWGLVVPFLENGEESVQFFGAHTVQVKIARDWDSFPREHVQELRMFVIDATANCIVLGRSKVILRKLFVALSSLAIRVAPEQWPDWISSTVATFSTRGSSTEKIIDFLAIIAEEVHSADLIQQRKTLLNVSLRDAVPLVLQAITASLNPSAEERQVESALHCLEAWLAFIPASDLNSLIQPLFALLNPSMPQFSLAVSAMNSILSSTAYSKGAGSRVLTEPLLLWFAQWGPPIVAQASLNGPDESATVLCKLLVGLGDHSSEYLAQNIACTRSINPAFNPVSAPSSSTPPTRAQLVQNFMQLMLSFASLPGFYGVDEEESEMTLGFWYAFQDTLWDVEVPAEDQAYQSGGEDGMMAVSKAVYAQLVRALRNKVRWPSGRSGWTKDQVDKFNIYRRDVGDTLINAYYVVREDMLAFYLTDLSERLSSNGEPDWEEVEATLHCISSIQEALPVDKSEHLSRLFSGEILGRIPTAGHERVRRTALVLIGSYASWFTTLPIGSQELLNAVGFVVNALPDQALCLPAANALRDLCDNNRVALAPHIVSFGELHASLAGISDFEKAKVLQSIASVIQALPLDNQISPVEAIVSPVVSKLFQALQASATMPDDSRTLTIAQLQTLSGVAKGLTRANDVFDLDDDGEEDPHITRARQDDRMVRLREKMLAAIRAIIEVWSTDAGVSDAISDLFKSITALPSDNTLISLPAIPLLELVCQAARKGLTAIWLSLANVLVIQLNPTTPFKTLRPTVASAAVDIVRNFTVALVETTLALLGMPGRMEENPDIVQEFFHFLEKVSHHFVTVFFQLSQAMLDSLMACAITSLSLPERYSLVASAGFLGSLINRAHGNDELGDNRHFIVQRHGPALMRSLLLGFAGSAPKSTVANLGELFNTLITKYPGESRGWIMQVLYGEDFAQSRVDTQGKEAFVKAVYAPGAGTLKKRREAFWQSDSPHP